MHSPLIFLPSASIEPALSLGRSGTRASTRISGDSPGHRSSTGIQRPGLVGDFGALFSSQSFAECARSLSRGILSMACSASCKIQTRWVRSVVVKTFDVSCSPMWHARI